MDITLRFICKCSSFLPRRILKLIFFSLGQSNIIYGCQLFESSPKYLLNKLHMKYNECMRAIYGFNRARYIRTEQILEELEILSFPDVLHKFTCIFITNCINGTAPGYLTSFFSNINSRTLNVTIPRVNSHYGQLSFSYRGPFLWNQIPTELKRKLLE